MTYPAAVAGLIAIIAAASHARAGDLEIDGPQVESLIRDLMQKRDIPAVCVGIVDGDKLVYSAALGEIDRSKHTPAAVDSLFQIGSVTKTFTATLLCHLRDQGLVKLDDPVSKYVPCSVPKGPAGTPITLLHLATHTSGLPANPPNRRDVPGSPSVMMPYSVEELYTGLATTKLQSEPGAKFSYSNFGYGLLGHALEQAGGGRAYERLVKEWICTPMGLKSTVVTLGPKQRESLAAHYWPQGPRVERPCWEFGEVCAFGGLASNVPDLAQFLSLQLREGQNLQSPIRGASLTELHTPRVQTGNERMGSVGLAWMVMEDKSAGPIIGHGGEVDGHSAMLAFLPRQKVGVVVLANVGGDTAEAIYRKLSVYLMPIVLKRGAQR